MILLDAVFVIEFLWSISYLPKKRDILFELPYMEDAIFMDILLLENQLPYFLLEELYKIACEDLIGRPFINLCSVLSLMVQNFWTSLYNHEGLIIKHFTDLIRNVSFNPHVIDAKQRESFYNLPSATRLDQSGLKFKPLRGGSRLLDIEFRTRKQLLPLCEVGELHMPIFKIEDNTETIIQNVMALEQCHYPNHTYFCNYIHLLDKLIDTKDDVRLLTEKGILENFLESDKAVAMMIDKLAKNIMIGPSPYFDIARNLNSHYKNRSNHAKVTLRNVYFNNRWRGIATIAAVSLLVLTLVQTICSILQVIKA